MSLCPWVAVGELIWADAGIAKKNKGGHYGVLLSYWNQLKYRPIKGMRRSMAAVQAHIEKQQILKRIMPGKVVSCPQIIPSFLKKINSAICII